MKTKLAVIFFLFFLICSAQEKYEYLGAIKLNGNSETVITYRLVFAENHGIIEGYSVTDLGGPHETKNIITGTYDAKKKYITFKEKDILYTKSTISDDMFCFVNFSGTVKLVNNNSLMSGEFKGLFKNNQKCIDGTLTLMGSTKLYKILGKVNKKLQKSSKVDEKVKLKSNPVAMLDSLRVNNLTKSQNLNVFSKTGKVTLEVWDNGKEDGDVISIYQGDKPILQNYTVKNTKKVLTLDVNKSVRFRITAVSEGQVSPNTVVVKVLGDAHVIEVYSSLKKDEDAFITIIKKED
ncbi:MAG: hypothetical protein ACLGH8_11905 [Bacteroidia bacterium]